MYQGETELAQQRGSSGEGQARQFERARPPVCSAPASVNLIPRFLHGSLCHLRIGCIM